MEGSYAIHILRKHSVTYPPTAGEPWALLTMNFVPHAGKCRNPHAKNAAVFFCISLACT